MKIVHINLFDAYGGAARIANEIMAYSRQQGHIVHQFVFRHTLKDDLYTIPIGALPVAMQDLYAQCEAKGGLMAYFAPYLMRVVRHPVFQQADVVHLHCINGGYFSVLLLPFLGKKKLIWTFHDTMAYTAHCLYPHICDRWQTLHCNDCPMDKQMGVDHHQRGLFQEIKANVLKITPMTVVAPSRWIFDMVKQSIFS